MKRKIYLTSIIALAILAFTWYFATDGDSERIVIRVPVEFGDFEVTVTTTGELEAKSSEDIYGPTNLRTIQIWGEIKINELVAEGTIVDSGDFVASLDQTEVISKIKDLETELEKLESQYTKTMLDTSLNLRNTRNDLVNLKFAMEEAQIALDQSQFEPPATQRQAKITLEKAERTYNQAVENYDLRYEKAKAEMQEVGASLQQAKRRKQQMVEILNQFTVKAPKDGMIIYKRNWRGQKTQTGSTIASWDPVVARLPDLTNMISKTYVNEIDVSKIKAGQNVRVSLDAFPEAVYSGVVEEVANIGQQNQGSDAKVFEVIISINKSDSIMRPSMTTKNEISTATLKDVHFIPLEALYNNDSISFVFMDKGSKLVRQQVIPGISNENDIVITQGLTQGDEVYLSIPENPDQISIIPLNQ
jgi:HlyD family secretion protein